MFFLIERDFEYAFNTVSPEDYWHAEAHVAFAIVVGEQGRKRENGVFVLENGFGDFADGGGDRVAGKALIVDDAVGGGFGVLIALLGGLCVETFEREERLAENIC